MRLRSASTAVSRALIALALLLGLASTDAQAAVAIDAVTSPAPVAQAVTTFSHTVSGGTNRLLLVGVSTHTATVSSVTFNGVAMQQLSTLSNGGIVAVYRQLMPTSGTHSVVVTLSVSDEVIIGAVSFTGVDQGAPLGAVGLMTGTSTGPTYTLPSRVGDFVFDVIASAGSSMVSSGAQTSQWAKGWSGIFGGGGTRTGAATVSTSWTTTSAAYALISVDVRQTDAKPGSLITGRITGNGVDNTAIANQTGFEPDFVFIKGETTQIGVARSVTMNGDKSKPMTGSTALTADLIESFDVPVAGTSLGGFTIGADARVNTSGVAYDYMALTALAGQVVIGSYVGNGTDNRSITDLGIQPDMVWLFSDAAFAAMYRSSTYAPGALQFDNSGAVSNCIQAFETNGFQVGTDNRCNSAGTTFHYIAWNQVASRMAVGTFTGNAADNRNIALPSGFGVPEFVMIRGTGLETTHKMGATTPSTDSSCFFDAVVCSSNNIQALQTDGFQVGTAYNGNAVTFDWMALGRFGTATAVKMASSSAVQSSAGTLLQWRTAYELDNLGFHVYRDVDGVRTRLTASLVAGSGLLVSAGTPATAGHGYQWLDVDASRPNQKVTYWIEDVDLHGSKTMHGPIVPKISGPQGLADPAWLEVMTSLMRAADWSAQSTQDASARSKAAVAALQAQARVAAPSGSIPSAPIVSTVMPQLPSGALRAVLPRPLPRPSVSPVVTAPVLPAPAAPPVPPVVILPPPVAVTPPAVVGAVSPAAPPVAAPMGGPFSGAMLAPMRVAPAAPPSPTALAVQQALAGQPTIKVSVKAEGWYRVTQAQLAAAGLPATVQPQTLQLFVDGEEQPLVVRSARPDRFGPGDSLEFYGTGVDTPYTATRVYWVTVGRGSGLRVARVAPASTVGQPARSFPFTVEVKDRSVFFAALQNGDAENFFGAIITPEPTDVIVAAPHVDLSVTASLEVTLQGVSATPGTTPNHHVAVLINGVSLGTVEFDGQAKGLQTFTVPAGLLGEGTNVVTVAALGDESDVSLVDSLRLTYAHTFEADGDRLRMLVQGAAPIVIAGFSTGAIHVFDVTDPQTVTEVMGRVTAGPAPSGYTVAFGAPGTGPRTLLAVIDPACWTPAAVRANAPSSWHAAGRSADYLLITPGEFASALGPLKALRMSQGHTVAVVDIEDVYDEFSFGQKTPYALRDFFIRAKAAWSRAPRFVTLVGNATTDPRDYLHTGEIDYLPTKVVTTRVLETASDDWFVDADGDGIPELAAIGRLPARTPEQAAVMAAKIVAYEQAPESGWSKGVTLVADETDVDGQDFETASTIVQQWLPADSVVTDVFRGVMGTEAAHTRLLSQINQGQGLVNYAGHGSVDIWKDNLFTTDDVSALTNAGRLALFVIMDCLNGFFHGLYPEESLAEALVRAGNGGAVAVWASSGLTDPSGQGAMNHAFYRLLYGGTVATVGEAVTQAKQATNDLDVRRTWIFFGDPAMRLKGMPPLRVPSGSSVAVAPELVSHESASSSALPVPADPATPVAWPTVHLVDWNGDGRAEALLVSATEWRVVDVGADGGSGGGIRARGWDMAGEAYPANLDGDGRLDMLWFDRASGTWAQALNTGNGTVFTTRGEWGGEWTVQVGDLNGDGVDDVLLTNPETGVWFTGLNDRHGGFTYRSGQWAPAARATLGDFTGDGRVDAFLYDPATGAWTLAISDGAGGFGFVSGQWLAGWTVQAANVNGDARTDLLLYNATTGAWAEAASAGGGVFTLRGGMWAPALSVHVLAGARPRRDDLLLYSAGTGQWTLLAIQDPVGALPAVTSGRWIPGLMIGSGDIDGDGRADLVLYDQATGLWGRALRPTPQRLDYRSGQWEPGWTLLGRP